MAEDKKDPDEEEEKMQPQEDPSYLESTIGVSERLDKSEEFASLAPTRRVARKEPGVVVDDHTDKMLPM